MSASAQDQSWTFVSSPDIFNSDIADLSGSTPGVPKAAGWPKASGGTNGVSPAMVEVYNQLVKEMASHNPQAFVVAGDLINGRWFNRATLDMFDPKGRDRAKAINKAAEIYYGWYQHLFKTNGINRVIAAVGDHDIGDNDWHVGGEKSRHVMTMRRAFGKEMVDPLGLPDKVAGVSSRPIGTDYQHSSYAYQLRNVLFVSVDIFRQDSPKKKLSDRLGSVTGDVSGDHLRWLDEVLAAAGRDASIDHIIVQGHAPCLPAVRKDSSSGMMMDERDDSPFWKTLRAHSHDRGGKVRFYFGGEVHTVTSTKDAKSDIVQLVHGNPPLGGGAGNYIVFRVFKDRIEAKLHQFDLHAEEGAKHQYWQPSNNSKLQGPTAMSPSKETGDLTINAAGKETTYETSGWLDFVDYKGSLIRIGFDQTNDDGSFHNSATMGDLYYAGKPHGRVELVMDITGKAGRFDGKKAYVRSGMLPKTDSEGRSITAWVKTDHAGIGTILGCGMSGRVKGGVFNVLIDEGRLALSIGPKQIAYARRAPRINDGQWHHIAIVLPDRRDNRLGQTVFYIDGQQYTAETDNLYLLINTYPGFQSHVHIGSANQGNAPYFKGDLDEVTFWGGSLSAEQVASDQAPNIERK